MGVAMEEEGLPLTATVPSSASAASSNNTRNTIRHGSSLSSHNNINNNREPVNDVELTTASTVVRGRPQLRSEYSSSFNSSPSFDEDEESRRIKQQREAQAQHHAIIVDDDVDGVETSDSSADGEGEEDTPFLDSDSEEGGDRHHTHPTKQENRDDKNSNNNNNDDNNNNNNGSLWDIIKMYALLIRDDIMSYLNLLRYNRAFRLFLISYVFGHMGEWFTYIASISLMERILGEDSEHSRTMIGILVMIRLLPTVVLSPFGGVLADSYDRRKSMIVLDLIGACTPIFFIMATFFVGTADNKATISVSPYVGVAMIYFATICQECVCALYEPCRTSMVPLLVTNNDNDLKKATTLTGVAWSAVAGFGAALGGFATSYFGARACFCMDGLCYLISALLMWSVGGNWKVAPDAKYESVWQQIKGMTVDGAKYLSSSFFGGLVFLKASCALVTGATNVLNVSLSERDGDDGIWFIKDWELDTEQKLGILFSITGIGCILGPLVADPLTDIEQPKALQLACIYGFAAVTIACVGVGIFHPFWSVCLFSAMRSAGSGILWLDSQFLLQKFTAKEMLGRVSACDEALATLAEALSSLICGVMQDRIDLSPEKVSTMQAFLGFIFVIVWSMYHFSGRGAACKTLSNNGKLLKKSTYSEYDESSEGSSFSDVQNTDTVELIMGGDTSSSAPAKKGPRYRSPHNRPRSTKNIKLSEDAPVPDMVFSVNK